jgi:hypothetical protein
LALAALALASLVTLVGLISGSEAGAILALLMGPVFPVALIVLGASRQGRLGAIAGPLLGVAILLEGGLVAMLVLRGRVLEAPWFAGLPLAAVVQIYAMWVVPFLIVAVVYALTFESFTLTRDDLERLDEISKG